MKISQKSKGKHLNFHGHFAPPFFSVAPKLNTTEKRSVMGNPKALTGRKGGKLEERENMPKIYWSRLATLKGGTRALSGRKKLLSSFSLFSCLNRRVWLQWVTRINKLTTILFPALRVSFSARERSPSRSRTWLEKILQLFKILQRKICPEVRKCFSCSLGRLGWCACARRRQPFRLAI